MGPPSQPIFILVGAGMTLASTFAPDVLPEFWRAVGFWSGIGLMAGAGIWWLAIVAEPPFRRRWIPLSQAAQWFYNRADEHVRSEAIAAANNAKSDMVEGGIVGQLRLTLLAAVENGYCELRARRQEGLEFEKIKPEEVASLWPKSGDGLWEIWDQEDSGPRWIDAQINRKQLKAMLARYKSRSH